jgi:hypothetical protein
VSEEKPTSLTAQEWGIPKAEWGEGPWQHEPDRVEFKHVGLPCLMVRGPMGSWCGYVAVSPGHPFHGKDYDTPDVEAHGGLTYASQCAGHICHVPEPGEPDDVWWFGFDTGHCWDIMPAMSARLKQLKVELPSFPPHTGNPLDGITQYRDMNYVRAEVERLAEQLAKVNL